ncbi:MAG: hypothetical protein IT368_10235, partial [Candidatus Hydrogenedentes bacterium]|nr:hypothetical protein [Candidatus Hydrogenedentota bacterium]
METEKNAPEDAQPKPKRRRWLRRVILGTFLTVLLIIVAGGTLWYLGVPQQAVLHYVSRLIGADITIDRMHVGSSVLLSGIAVRDGASEPAPFQLSLVEISYDPLPEDGRYLQKIDLRAPEIDLQRQPDGSTNYDFLLELLKQPRGTSAGPGSAWLPKEVAVAGAGLHFETPNGSVRLGPIDAAANLASAEFFSVTLGGEVDIEAIRAGSVIIDEQGELTAKVEREGNEYAVRAHADLPALAELETEGQFSRRDEGWYADVRVDALTLAPAAAAGVLATFLPAPLQFERLELTESWFQGLIALDSMSVPNAQVNLAAQGLVAGPPAAPWYSGDLQVKGTSSAEGDALTLSAKLARGQQVEATVSGGLDEGHATLSFAGWSEPDIESIIPGAYREAVAPRLHLRELKAAAGMGWKEHTYTADVHLDVVTSAGTPAVVNVEGTGPLGQAADGAVFTGPVGVSLGDQKVAGELKVAHDRGIEFAGTLDQVDPNAWLQAWLDQGTLKGLAAPLSGTIGIEYAAGSDALPITLDLAAPEFRYSSGAFTMASPIAAQGTLVYNTEA